MSIGPLTLFLVAIALPLVVIFCAWSIWWCGRTARQDAALIEACRTPGPLEPEALTYKENPMDEFKPVTDWEYQRLMQIMKENGNKSFVQRILRPNEFPTLDLGDGNYATHRMAWGQLGDKYVAYPTVLMNENGKLQDYAGDAWNHVQQTDNYITFDNPDEADWFAKSYKGAWGGQMNKPPK